MEHQRGKGRETERCSEGWEGKAAVAAAWAGPPFSMASHFRLGPHPKGRTLTVNCAPFLYSFPPSGAASRCQFRAAVVFAWQRGRSWTRIWNSFAKRVTVDQQKIKCKKYYLFLGLPYRTEPNAGVWMPNCLGSGKL